MAASLWPWLAIAAAGALHGLNPLTGWAFGACAAPGTPAQRRVLVPVAAGLALWSFCLNPGHLAGWMLVPLLASVCGGDGPGQVLTASGSLLLGSAAVGVHLAAMLATTAALAAGARHSVNAARGWPRH